MKSIIKFFCCFAICLTLFTCSVDNNSPHTILFTGELEWAKTFGGSQNDFAFSVIQTQDSNLVIFGYTGSTDGDIIDKSIQEHDYWLIKLDLEGNLLWSKTYGGSGEDVGEGHIN